MMNQRELAECLKKVSYDTIHIVDDMLEDNANKVSEHNPIFKNGQLRSVKKYSTVNYARINRLLRHEERLIKSPSFQLAVNTLSDALKIVGDIDKLSEDVKQLAKEEICNFITQYASERQAERSGAFIRSIKRFHGRIRSELSYFSYITPLYNVGGDFFEMTLSKTTRIRLVTDKEYVRIIDVMKPLKEIESYQRRLRFVIEYRASVNTTRPLHEAKEEYALVTNLIRLTRKCAPEFGQIYLSNSTHMDVLGVESAESYESTPQRRGFVELDNADRCLLVARYCDLTLKLNRCKKCRFLANSIARFGMACRHRRHSNKLVDYVISLEALLTEGPGESTFKLAHRAAALCGNDHMNRLQIWEFVKEVYKFRSGVVHKSSEKPFIINSKTIGIDEVSYNLDTVVRTAILRMLTILDVKKSKEEILNQLDRSIYDKNLMQELENLWS